MGKNGLKLLDLAARSEHVSELDKSKTPTKFLVGSLSSRQMFKIMAKYGSDTKNAEMMASCAMQFVKYGLKGVEGNLGEGFKLIEDTKLGWKCEAVDDNYLDRLPMQLLSEVATWVTDMSKVGELQKKV